MHYLLMPASTCRVLMRVLVVHMLRRELEHKVAWNSLCCVCSGSARSCLLVDSTSLSSAGICRPVQNQETGTLSCHDELIWSLARAALCLTKADRCETRAGSRLFLWRGLPLVSTSTPLTRSLLRFLSCSTRHEVSMR